MKRLPYVSVIIPTLNEEKYIENCLKVLRNQDYEGEYEIIVADGKSKDKTVKIAKKYADKVVVVEKKGAAAGRNAGARVARGEILIFIDADTIPLFNGISEIVKGFKRGVVGVTCPVIPSSPSAGDFLIYWFYNQFSKATIKAKKPHVAGMICAYRRDAFEKIGGFREDFTTTLDDYDLSKKMGKLGKVNFVETTVAMTSPRRIRKWGKTKTAARYVKIYLNYLLAGKTAKPEEYKPIR